MISKWKSSTQYDSTLCCFSKVKPLMWKRACMWKAKEKKNVVSTPKASLGVLHQERNIQQSDILPSVYVHLSLLKCCHNPVQRIEMHVFCIETCQQTNQKHEKDRKC